MFFNKGIRDEKVINGHPEIWNARGGSELIKRYYNAYIDVWIEAYFRLMGLVDHCRWNGSYSWNAICKDILEDFLECNDKPEAYWRLEIDK